MVTLRSRLEATPSPGILSFWPVVPNLSTRGKALLAAFGLHKEVVITEKGKKEDTQNMSNTKQPRRVGGGILPPRSCASSRSSIIKETVPLESGESVGSHFEK